MQWNVGKYLRCFRICQCVLAFWGYKKMHILLFWDNNLAFTYLVIWTFQNSCQKLFLEINYCIFFILFSETNSLFLQVENVFSFRLLSCLVSDLDVQLFIQTKIDLKNMINEYMENCKHEDQTIVIMDEIYLILQKIDSLISSEILDLL